MNIFELDQSLRKEKSIEEGHGRYWCSTDKKWKERQGPKQTRKTESATPNGGISKEKETEFHADLDKLVHKTFGKRKDEDQGVAEGSNVDSQIKRIKDRILQLKDWNTAGTHDKKIKELQARLKELQQQKQGVAEGNPIDTDWYRKQQERQTKAKQRQQGVAEDQVDEVSVNPEYLRAAERSLSQARDTQRQYWKSPEEKAAARRTELKREKGIGGYTKRHRAANPEMYPKVKAQPATKLRDPSTEYSDDYSVWAAGRRNTMEQGVAEGDNEKIGGRYDPEQFDAMVSRVGQRAKQGPLKTVYDPEKRVYKNVPADKDQLTKEAAGTISLSMNDGSTKMLRSGSPSLNAVKAAMGYLVRSKDFETLKNLKAVDGHDVRGIVGKMFKSKNTVGIGEALDTEFQNFLKQAKHRYPDSKDENEAFMRYVHDELEKEGRVDKGQTQEINDLESKLDSLIADLSKMAKASKPDF